MKSKLFNNYQLYTVLHPEDNSPAFSHAHSSAIRVMKPDKKCKRSTREYLNDGCIPDKTENSDVVADISITDLLLQGVQAGLPCLAMLQKPVKAVKVVAPTKVPKYTKKQFYKDLAKAMNIMPLWRRGQAAFNTAALHCATKADELRGGPLDPYYDDTRIEAFVEACLGTKKGAKK